MWNYPYVEFYADLQNFDDRGPATYYNWTGQIFYAAWTSFIINMD